MDQAPYLRHLATILPASSCGVIGHDETTPADRCTMKLRLDLVLCAALIATAGSELVAPDALSAARPTQACQPAAEADAAAPDAAAERILAEGYSEVSILTKGCDNAWHGLALADGDPVNVLVTPLGAVLTE